MFPFSPSPDYSDHVSPEFIIMLLLTFAKQFLTIFMTVV